MSARFADAVRSAAPWALAALLVACRRGDTKPLPPPGAPPGKMSDGSQAMLAAAPPAVRLALELRQEAKAAKWRNERPMMLRVVPKDRVPDSTADDGALPAGTCAELCLAEEAKCWSVDANAPAYRPKQRRPAVDCTDGHSVSITKEEFAALEPHASERQELDEATCRERCKSEGCFLAGYAPQEIQPVHDDERLVLCGATKIVADPSALEKAPKPSP